MPIGKAAQHAAKIMCGTRRRIVEHARDDSLHARLVPGIPGVVPRHRDEFPKHDQRRVRSKMNVEAPDEIGCDFGEGATRGGIQSTYLHSDAGVDYAPRICMAHWASR